MGFVKFWSVSQHHNVWLRVDAIVSVSERQRLDECLVEYEVGEHQVHVIANDSAQVFMDKVVATPTIIEVED